MNTNKHINHRIKKALLNCDKSKFKYYLTQHYLRIVENDVKHFFYYSRG